MADSLGVGFRYEEIYEMCQAAVSQEKEKNIKDQKDSKVEMVGTRQRKRFKNSFKTQYQENARRYRQVQMSVRIVGGIRSDTFSYLKNIFLYIFIFFSGKFESNGL